MANPVNSAKPSSVLEESAKIKDELLKVQAKIEGSAREIEVNLVAEARKKLGYRNVEDAGASNLVDHRVDSKTAVISPELVSAVLPVSEKSVEITEHGREDITDIIKHQNKRLMVVVGPCSIHDPKAALEYAHHVQEWREQYGDQLEIIMRTYFEKPRTELGWKGFIYDPKLDESNDINLGLIAARMLACQITNMGVPIAVERLNALTPQYLNALVSYDVIGSRNTRDQKSREYASATSSPVGFKNPPLGDIKAAAEAAVSASGAHAFLGIGMNGVIKQINTKGNDTGHIILRGADKGPNYDAASVADTRRILETKGRTASIVIDASHANSGKKAINQMKVINDVVDQIKAGETAIVGVMVESNLVAGNQKLVNPRDLVYGKSITDECVDVGETADMLEKLSAAVVQRTASSRIAIPA